MIRLDTHAWVWADQLLVATARVLEVPLATADQKILDYPHVETLRFAV